MGLEKSNCCCGPWLLIGQIQRGASILMIFKKAMKGKGVGVRIGKWKGEKELRGREHIV